jgi:hypothetical protein
MKVEAIHHVPMRPEFKSPFSAAYAIEGGRLIFFSGCCTIPTYHKHPHDPEEEQQWLAADFRAQTERTFAHIKEIMDAAGARMADILNAAPLPDRGDACDKSGWCTAYAIEGGRLIFFSGCCPEFKSSPSLRRIWATRTSSTRSPPATSTRTGRRRVPWWAYRRWRIREC